MREDHKSYRPCVGMMILNRKSEIFVGNRIKNRRSDRSIDAWQMPQGGVNEGESLEDAMHRELKEEIGINAIEVIGKTNDWLYYDIPLNVRKKLLWGNKFKGQRQRWFLLRFTGNDSEINVYTDDPEFESWKWVNSEYLLENIVSFKRKIYKDILSEFCIDFEDEFKK